MTEYWQNVYLVHHGIFLSNKLSYGVKFRTREDAVNNSSRLIGILIYRLHVKLKS